MRPLFTYRLFKLISFNDTALKFLVLILLQYELRPLLVSHFPEVCWEDMRYHRERVDLKSDNLG